MTILRSDPDTLYGEMAARMTEVQEAIVAEGAKVGLPLVISGAPACTIFNLAMSDQDADESVQAQFLRANAIKLVGEALAESGVLLSNLNRLYGNISLRPDDVALFRARAPEAFAEVGAFLSRMAPSRSGAGTMA